MNARAQKLIEAWSIFGTKARARLGWNDTDDTWTAQDFAPLQPSLEDILGERPPPWLRSAHYSVAGLFVGLLVVSMIVQVDVIVAASGRLTTESPTIAVQPLHAAVIREIKVRPGDEVHAGDVLATLDPTFTEADRNALAAQQTVLRAQIDRLEAEMQDLPFHPTGTTPEVQLQYTLYLRRQGQYQARLQAFDEDIARYQSTIGSTESNKTSLAKQADIAREVETMRAKLYQLQSGSKLNLLDAQASRMRTERDYEDAANHITEARHMLQTRRAEREVFVEEWRQQILEELMKARSEAKNVSESLVKATRMNDMEILSAPVDAVVLDIGKKGAGSIAQDAEPIITLVPASATLIGDVMIASADVGYTKTGDEVQIKLDAFPYQRHGLIKGRLRAIGQDSITPGSSAGVPPAGTSSTGVFHRSRVELTDTRLRNQPEGTHLIPGMTMTAEIKVGSRSVFSYFFNPIVRGLSESIREP